MLRGYGSRVTGVPKDASWSYISSYWISLVSFWPGLSVFLHTVAQCSRIARDNLLPKATSICRKNSRGKSCRFLMKIVSGKLINLCVYRGFIFIVVENFVIFVYINRTLVFRMQLLHYQCAVNFSNKHQSHQIYRPYAIQYSIRKTNDRSAKRMDHSNFFNMQ